MAISELPKKINSNISNNAYQLIDFINKSNIYIKNSNTSTILVDYQTIKDNLDTLKKVIYLCNITQINCLDYESALFLEKELDENIVLSLVDDYENKDRSYIDVTKFKNHVLYIPLSYFMWNPNFDSTCNIHCLRYDLYTNMISMSGDKTLTKDTLYKVKKIITDLNASNLSDIDKCLIVSNYLQSKVQYVSNNIITSSEQEYIIDAKKEDVVREKVSSINTVLDESYGLCIAIANTTTLLLNNPTFNINTRSLYGCSHVWNVVVINGKKYYMDNTWNITRNKDKVKEALKAKSFSDEYLLFGLDTAKRIGYHNSDCYIDGYIEDNDYDKIEIHLSRKKLSKSINFKYDEKLRFNSRIYK